MSLLRPPVMDITWYCRNEFSLMRSTVARHFVVACNFTKISASVFYTSKTCRLTSRDYAVFEVHWNCGRYWNLEIRVIDFNSLLLFWSLFTFMYVSLCPLSVYFVYVSNIQTRFNCVYIYHRYNGKFYIKWVFQTKLFQRVQLEIKRTLHHTVEQNNHTSHT